MAVLDYQRYNAGQLGTVMEVGGDTLAFMSGLEMQFPEGEPEVLVGNVLRRTCSVVGESACAQTCQLAALRGEAPESEVREETRQLVEQGHLPSDPEALIDQDETACADYNMLYVLDRLNIEPRSALMVGVTADGVGFLDDPEVRNQITRNPQGWSEVAGYNAFFARHDSSLPAAGESGETIHFLGARLADSGFLVIEMTDRAGGKVSGIIHSTRTNMPGREHRKEYGGVKQSFVHYALSEALSRYDVDPSQVTVRVVAAVGPESWQKRYPNARVLEENLPGWAEDGLIDNRTNPDWQPGMELNYDELWPQYPHKVRMEAIEACARLGIEKVLTDDPLDPGKPRNGIVHSSANRRRFAQPGDPVVDGRDVYAVLI